MLFICLSICLCKSGVIKRPRIEIHKDSPLHYIVCVYHKPAVEFSEEHEHQLLAKTALLKKRSCIQLFHKTGQMSAESVLQEIPNRLKISKLYAVLIQKCKITKCFRIDPSWWLEQFFQMAPIFTPKIQKWPYNYM